MVQLAQFTQTGPEPMFEFIRKYDRRVRLNEVSVFRTGMGTVLAKLCSFDSIKLILCC